MEVVDLLLRFLSAKSITPDDGGLMEYIEGYLDGYDAIYKNEGGVKNLFLYKRFGDGEHLCFAGHVDVVPPGSGWSSEPFTPKIEDGYIYARGSQDMKSGVAASVEALARVEDFNGTLSLLLTSDEEGDATYGTQIMLKELQDRDLLPDYAIVGEPTSEERFGDAIKIGRRGSINGVLKLYGLQGHAAYPEKSKNPIDMIAPILPKIAGVNLDNGDEHFAPSRFVITDIRAGMEVTNVTPGELKMMFNVRNSTKTTQEDIKEFIDSHFRGLDYTLKLSQSAYPFVTNPDTKVVELVDRAITNVCGTPPKHSTAGGTSDARFFAKYGVKTIECGVVNDRIHAPNERVGIDEVEALFDVYTQVIREF